jgi:YebC/PmpR family DNA-binding regulatory protein
VDKARAENMPKDNIERAIKRGAGEDKDGTVFEEITFEGYGPHGSALMVTCVTDNRNRTVPDMRHAFTKYGGNMAEQGAVGWQFDRKAYFAFPSSEMSFDKAFELGIEAGADDVVDGEETIEIYAHVELFKTVADALHKAHVHPQESGLRMVPKQEMELDVESTLKFMRMIEAIEELDDVQDVFHNVKVSDEALAALEAA